MFVFNGSEISSPPPPSESYREDILPPIPSSSKNSPSRYDLEDEAVGHETMPTEFYSNVDQFLSLNPPSIKTILGGKKKSDRRSAEQPKNERLKPRKNKSASSSSDSISKTQSMQQRNVATTGTASRKKINGGAEAFDYKLLAEAMKFTDLSNIDDEQTDGLARGSPPRQGNPVQALRRRKETSEGPKGGFKDKGKPLSKKQGSKVPVSSVYESSRSNKNTTSSKQTRQSKKGRSSTQAFDGQGDNHNINQGGDMESMVQNFEQGLELSRLRAELAASQQRMQNSTSAIKSAASEFYGPSSNK